MALFSSLVRPQHCQYSPGSFSILSYKKIKLAHAIEAIIFFISTPGTHGSLQMVVYGLHISLSFYLCFRVIIPVWRILPPAHKYYPFPGNRPIFSSPWSLSELFLSIVPSLLLNPVLPTLCWCINDSRTSLFSQILKMKGVIFIFPVFYTASTVVLRTWENLVTYCVSKWLLGRESIKHKAFYGEIFAKDWDGNLSKIRTISWHVTLTFWKMHYFKQSPHNKSNICSLENFWKIHEENRNNF